MEKNSNLLKKIFYTLSFLCLIALILDVWGSIAIYRIQPTTAIRNLPESVIWFLIYAIATIGLLKQYKLALITYFLIGIYQYTTWSSWGFNLHNFWSMGFTAQLVMLNIIFSTILAIFGIVLIFITWKINRNFSS